MKINIQTLLEADIARVRVRRGGRNAINANFIREEVVVSYNPTRDRGPQSGSARADIYYDIQAALAVVLNSSYYYPLHSSMSTYTTQSTSMPVASLGEVEVVSNNCQHCC